MEISSRLVFVLLWATDSGSCGLCVQMHKWLALAAAEAEIISIASHVIFGLNEFGRLGEAEDVFGGCIRQVCCQHVKGQVGRHLAMPAISGRLPH